MTPDENKRGRVGGSDQPSRHGRPGLLVRAAGGWVVIRACPNGWFEIHRSDLDSPPMMRLDMNGVIGILNR